MSHPADTRQTQNPNDQQHRNAGNLVDNSNYYDYSSMSALASAAGLQDNPSNNQFHGADVPHPANFGDIDSQLHLYGDLQQASSHTYQNFIESGAIDGTHDGTTYQGTNPDIDWYNSQISSIPQFIDNFSQFNEAQPVPEQLGTTTSNKASRNVPNQIINGESSVTSLQAPHQEMLDPPPMEQEPPSHDAPVQQEQPSPMLKKELVEDSSESPTPEIQPQIDQADSVPIEKKAAPPVEKPDSLLAKLVDPGLASDSSAFRTKADFKPKISIPTDISAEEHAQQCVLAAYASRLNPFALHTDEHKLLRTHINQIQVTVYLNIRNAILRLWTRNPLVSVSREEAAGCAKDFRWFDLADVAYTWLVRNGYINFGCAEVPNALLPLKQLPQPTVETAKPQKTIAVIGAGMAGLGCARQLEGLFKQFASVWTAHGEAPPKVVVLEGRNRVGGRVFSKLLADQNSSGLPEGRRSTAEMGAQIITGFDHGNPLNFIIRGQLALPHHLIKDNSVLYDYDGTLVDKSRDILAENLYNNILDRASVYRRKLPTSKIVEGEKELIASWKDPASEGGRPISIMEDAAARIPVAGGGFDSHRNNTSFPLATGIDRLTGKSNFDPQANAQGMGGSLVHIDGWAFKNEEKAKTINLEEVARSHPNPTLGAVMDEAVRQYQGIVAITPQDMRLLNWHFANLEYANAVNLNQLSLGSWDLDIGNEFEGEHAEIIGGYSQVPFGLWTAPTKLDVRFDKAVSEIRYDSSASDKKPSKAHVICSDGEELEVDGVVLTAPLGVLKSGSINFDPQLPDWKSKPVERLGYGTLNKVVLIFERAFWDVDRDIFGALRKPSRGDDLDQQFYHEDRGKCYIFWNCVKLSGKPMLVAVMAGDAALSTNNTPDEEIIDDATNVLRKIFTAEVVPEPTETIITRWGKDRFSRGSYSYVGPEAHADDYDSMAKSVGNLFFAGEATCGTHPATVHGAYLSGLRAASEVLTSLIGPIGIQKPLVPPKSATETPAVDKTVSKKRKVQSAEVRLKELRDQRNESYEAAVGKHIISQIGEQPVKPGRSGVNPFLLYQKDHWHICKAQQDAQRQQTTKDPGAKAQRNDVRAALGKMWRDATEEEKRPYLEQTKDKKEQNDSDTKAFTQKLEQWSKEATKLATTYRETHVNRPSAEEERLALEVDKVQEKNKRGRTGV